MMTLFFTKPCRIYSKLYYIEQFKLLTMNLFLDTAELHLINYWLGVRGMIDGITTNPTILKKAGFTSPQEAWRKIIDIIRTHEPTGTISLSAEVFCDEPEKMIEQAHLFVQELNYPGLAIKIPILGLDKKRHLKGNLDVIEALAQDGIKVNCTACVTWRQAFAAADAGATYVSILYRRSIDAKLKGLRMIEETRRRIDAMKLGAKIIIGSIREPKNDGEANDVDDAFEAGAHIVTVPPEFMLYHPKSVATQKQFLTDAGVLPEEKK